MHITVEGNALDVGVVGLGKMGILHAATFNRVPGARLVAVAEHDPKIRSFAAKLLTRPHMYRDHLELLEHESPDILVVTTPTYLHGNVIRAALGQDVGIFCEKPLAPSYAEASQLATLGSHEETMAGFQKRFVPTFVHARRLVQDAVLGEVVRIRGSAFLGDVFRTPGSWRSDVAKGGGALTEWGIHLVDLLLWFFGDLRIRASFQRNPFSPKADDYTHAVFETKAGALGTIDVSWSHRGTRLPELAIELEGSRGSLLVTDDKVVLELDHPHGDMPSGTTTVYRAQLDERVGFLLGYPEFYHEDRAFVDSILNDEPTSVPFATAVEVHRVLEEIRSLASRNGGEEPGP